jgi:hypothetical protein
LSELPGRLFGRKKLHEEQRNKYKNRLQRHHKNSKGVEREEIKRLLGINRLEMFSLLKIMFLSTRPTPSSFMITLSFFF